MKTNTAAHIEEFRRKLEIFLKISQQKSEDKPELRGVYATVNGLLTDYNLLFPKEAFSNSKENIAFLAEKFCSTDKSICPICNSQMVLKKGKYGSFLSCSTYPKCCGARNWETGVAVQNDSLKLWLSIKLNEENKAILAEESKKRQNRFIDIDLE